jgi:hypothetical protein
VSPRVAVGGPIKKDKLFFFQSLEYRFIRNDVPSLEALNEVSVTFAVRVSIHSLVSITLLIPFTALPEAFRFSRSNSILRI